MSTTDQQKSAVTAMYEAFGRGDVPGVLSHLADEIAWNHTDEPWTPHAAGVPWLKPRRGHAEVVEFFEIVSAWKYERFEVLDMLSSDRQIAVELRLVAELPNGQRLDEVVIHLWTFGADGKVTGLREVLDTAADIEAARG